MRIIFGVAGHDDLKEKPAVDKYLLDTNVIIGHLRWKPSITSFLDSIKYDEKYFSVIAEIEVYAGARPEEKSKTDLFLSQMQRLDINKEVIVYSAEYLQKYSKSHELDLPDAIIAATAKAHKLTLLTSNVKHFPMKDISIIDPDIKSFSLKESQKKYRRK